MKSLVYVPCVPGYSFYNGLPSVPPLLGYSQAPPVYDIHPQYCRNEDSVQQVCRTPKRAYEKRNVYKSIIRHTFKHVQKNRKEMVGLLKKEGFEIDEIEVAFKEIAYLAKQESERGKPKNSKKALGKMLESKTIYLSLIHISEPTRPY
eukprot:TRINITY_DN5154_c0_g1_i4.p1 TRINITY_DN5154_c0_g1~~TRINITY_DN5154_c0_g1_i4.p1  ORF type:complete len:148 (-),score=30.11 TRINITY_DN5154_c0_g1_i4:48-491(-)